MTIPRADRLARAVVVLSILALVPLIANAQVIPPSRGGTGTSTVPSYGLVLVGNANGTYTLTATSSLGITGGGGGGSTAWGAITGTLSDQTDLAAALAAKLSLLDWYSTSTSDIAEGSNLYYTDARVNSYVSGSSTIPKTYLSNTFGGTQTFNNTISGSVTGNAGTATALAANGADCSAGSFPLGVDASGAVVSCTDAWTEAENTAAAYTPQSRQLTLTGTANEISISAGAQTLAADRTWVIEIPAHLIQSSLLVSTGSTTNATSTNQAITNLLTFNGTTSSTWPGFCVAITGGSGLCDGSDDGAGGGSGTVTQLDTTYPILGGPVTTTGTLSLAFGTTTINTWGAHNTYTSLFATNASTTNATTTSLSVTDTASTTNLVISGLGTGANRIVTVNGTGAASSVALPLTYANGGGGTISNSTGALAYYGPTSLQSVGTSSITVNAPLTSAGTPGFVVGGSGWTLDVDDVAAADLAAADFGSFTCNGTSCTVDSAAISNAMLANSTISGVALGSNLASLTGNGGIASDGTYNGFSARTFSLDMANANTWTAKQTFANSSTTLGSFSYSSSTEAYFGTAYIPSLGTAAGTFIAADANGKLIATSTPAGGSSLTGTTGQVAYFSGTNTAVGTSSITVASDKRVGIGTTSPSALLSVEADPSTYARPLFEIASGNGSATTTVFQVSSSTKASLGIGTSTSPNANVAFSATAGASASTTWIGGSMGDATSKFQMTVQTSAGGIACLFVNSTPALVVQSGACTY